MTFFAPGSGLDIALQRAVAPPTSGFDVWRGYRQLEGAGPYTFEDAEIGPASPQRIVVVGFFVSTASGLISSVTIGGVAATRVVSNTAVTTRLLELWEAVVPLGETADIVVTLTAIGTRIGLSWHTIIGAQAPFAARSGVAPTALASFNIITATLSPDVPAGGVTIAIVSHSSGAGGGQSAWTQSQGDGNERVDQQIAGGPWFAVYDTRQAGPLAITAGHLLANDNIRIAAASWGP